MKDPSAPGTGLAPPLSNISLVKRSLEFLFHTLLIFGLGLGSCILLLTDCPQSLNLNLIWPCLSMQALILILAVTMLFHIDPPGPCHHALLYMFFVMSLYLPLAILPCATDRFLKLAGVFALSHIIYFYSLIFFVGHLDGTGYYGEFFGYAGLDRAKACEGSVALPGPENPPSYTNPAGLATPKSDPDLTMV